MDVLNVKSSIFGNLFGSRETGFFIVAVCMHSAYIILIGERMDWYRGIRMKNNNGRKLMQP